MGTMTKSRMIKLRKTTSVCKICREKSAWGVCTGCQKKLGYV